MNRFLTLLALVFLLSKAADAQSIVTFKSLGHGEDAIYGMSGASSFYVKISPTVEINGSKLVLYLEPSQALLKDHSFVNIILNDKPVYSARLTKDSIEMITLNLNKDDVSPDRFLKIQIKTLLAITDDICRDLDNPAMWIKVKDYSYLSLLKNKNAATSDINISNCFDSKRAIVYPADPSLNDLKAVAWAYARLKKAGINNIPVFPADQKPDSLRSYIVVGNMSELSSEQRDMIKVTPQSGEGLF